ncbi:unnamed protein product [Cylicocyclus nassatus]|uniref:Uncharacterized protein n=1 Tax=Cylicocyclus nassatus TaxID=53992 RepID=A0AA36GUT4_CYLNA|nr:unnamed protein product [Cylicocyclus nassatus]
MLVEKTSDTRTAKPMMPIPITALYKEQKSTSSSTARSPDERFERKLFRYNAEDKRPAKHKPVYEHRQKAKKMEQKTPDSDSLKTARDISTISPSEAKKYSFLNKKEDNTVYEISEISDFDLYATKKKQPQPDLKKLEAYFALPQPAEAKSKSKESTESGKKSRSKTGGVQVRQLRTARKGGNTQDDKSSKRKLLKKVKARAIKSARSISRRELATSPKSTKKKSKESLTPVSKKISATNLLLHKFLRKKEVSVRQEKAETPRKTSQRTS